MDLVDRIVNNTTYDESDESLPHYRNIIINYMNGKDASAINTTQLNSLDKIEYARVKYLYYEIPILVHILNKYITELMTANNTNGDQSNSTTCQCEGNECYVYGN